MSAYREKVTPVPPATVKTPLLARLRPYRTWIVGFGPMPAMASLATYCVSLSPRAALGCWALGMLLTMFIWVLSTSLARHDQ